MKIRVDIEATFYDDDGKREIGGFTTHVINLTNKDALDRLVEHFQGDALDNFPLSISDCLPWDPEVDG
jgi:hypothetical protein